MPLGFQAEGGGRVQENTGKFGVGVQAAVKETNALVEHSNNFGKLHNFGSYVTNYGMWLACTGESALPNGRFPIWAEIRPLRQ
jgi:hypothetical protein